MQDTQLLQDGLALMGVGMGFVFVFLTALVLATTLMSLVVRRLAPTPVPAPSAPRPAADKGMRPSCLPSSAPPCTAIAAGAERSAPAVGAILHPKLLAMGSSS
ncbi:OadG family transporter subunit [Halomonas sp. E19]|uniref:OadG family transporter subunit n=1 Tax=Halomonas sp. E19 TaxID=3397247 RepID=UPI00403495EA